LFFCLCLKWRRQENKHVVTFFFLFLFCCKVFPSFY
jgi:hypothetical protein